ncbi:MAG: hypothetical protein M1818_003277 [Claussenomyces sp. TS43310]|nr:MAG: hypothetical protein M1818_003277 [Claussenomyces sp. TS43310]
METLPQSARIAQVLGFTSSGFLSGTILSISVFAMPTLTQSPTSLLLQQWRFLFLRGAARAPVLAVLSCLTSAYAAYARYSSAASGSVKVGGGDGDRSWLYPAATAVLTAGIIPFTFLFMAETNARLTELGRSVHGGEAKVSRAQVLDLVQHWTLLNGIRSCWPLVGCVVGIYGLLSS